MRHTHTHKQGNGERINEWDLSMLRRPFVFDDGKDLGDGQAIVRSVVDQRGRLPITRIETSTPVALGVTLVEELTEGPRHCHLK